NRPPKKSNHKYLTEMNSPPEQCVALLAWFDFSFLFAKACATGHLFFIRPVSGGIIAVRYARF
ncbi:MAG: hypothetical protein LC662_14665, partial [Rhodothermaceae bacterium]|nr:hypothetical protein [Rhodothermaceae bacterium]